ncbi:MAG: hypothetical protein LUD18_07485 [Lachnospiraceae bacterium]|nr:hypothetical protein [Lachnospiraceae bacterium]
MEANKMDEKRIGENALQDDDLDQVSGGTSTVYEGEFHVSIAEREKMNNLWNKMYAYGDYGKAVKDLVNTHVKHNGMETLNPSDFRYISKEAIDVYAKNDLVTVNGYKLILQ